MEAQGHQEILQVHCRGDDRIGKDGVMVELEGRG